MENSMPRESSFQNVEIILRNQAIFTHVKISNLPGMSGSLGGFQGRTKLQVTESGAVRKPRKSRQRGKGCLKLVDLTELSLRSLLVRVTKD